MKLKTFFVLIGLTFIAFQFSGCSNITGEKTTSEEPLTYRITKGACGEIIFKESIGTDSTTAVETIKQRKVEELGNNNFTIESTQLKVEDENGNVPEGRFYALHILDEDSLHLHSVSEVITNEGDLSKLLWCPD